MNGQLSEGRVPEILRELYVHRRTGYLYFERPENHSLVIFRRGCIIGGSTDAMGRRLGEVMVCDGLLSEDEMARVTAAAVRMRRPFGAVLEDLGLLDRGRFEDVLALYVREILLDVFSWENGAFRFEEREVADEARDDVTLKLSTGEIILEAVRLVNSRDAIRHLLGDLDRILVVSTDPLLSFQRITLSPTDGYLLSRIDGSLTARQTIEIAPIPAPDIERSLLGLLCTGMVEMVARPDPVQPAPRRGEEKEAPGKGRVRDAAMAGAEEVRQRVLDAFARRKTRNHFEALGVPVTASAAEVRAAYVRLAHVFHPDAQHDPALADLRDQLEQVFARVNEAYDALSHPDRRASYESYLARQHAPEPVAPAPPPEPAKPAELPEQALADAEQLFGEGRYWEVIGLIQGVLRQAQGQTRQRLRLLRGRAYLRCPDRRKEAIEELAAAVAADPSDAQAHYLLGTAYRDEGLKKRALGHFRKALELRPHYKEAQSEIATLEPAPDK
jgi:curved DNA-binding protein CbpA